MSKNDNVELLKIYTKPNFLKPNFLKYSNVTKSYKYLNLIISIYTVNTDVIRDVPFKCDMFISVCYACLRMHQVR